MERPQRAGGGALTEVGQEVQGAGVLGQGAQALDPAAAHSGRRPGRSAEGARLPEEPGQQLPLLEWRGVGPGLAGAGGWLSARALGSCAGRGRQPRSPV